MRIHVKENEILLKTEEGQDRAYLKDTLGLEEVGDEAKVVKSEKVVENILGKGKVPQYKIVPKEE